VDAHFNVISNSNLLPSIIVFIIIWFDWLTFWLMETQPIGKAGSSNILPLVALIPIKFMHLAKWLISPAILLLITQYSRATAHYSPRIFLYPKFLVTKHRGAGENTLTHSILHFLFTLFLLVSIGLTCINTTSPLIVDMHVDQFCPGIFSAAVRSCDHGFSWSLVTLSSSMSESLSASQSSSLSI